MLSRAITTLLCTTLLISGFSYADNTQRDSRHGGQSHENRRSAHSNNTAKKHETKQHKTNKNAHHRANKREPSVSNRKAHRPSNSYHHNKAPRYSSRYHGKAHPKKHYRDHRPHKHNQKSHHHNNDATLFLGGALLGAAIVDGMVDNTVVYRAPRYRPTAYHYEYDQRGDCYRVEYRGPNKKIMVAAPYYYCDSGY